MQPVQYISDNRIDLLQKSLEEKRSEANLLAQNECSDMKEELSILKHLEIFDRDIGGFYFKNV